MMDGITLLSEGEIRLRDLIERTKQQTLDELLAEDDSGAITDDAEDERFILQFISW